MESSPFLQELRQIYADYSAAVMTLELNRKPMAGLLGFGSGPGSDPCHDRFADAVEKALGRFALETPSSEEIRAVLRYMFDASGGELVSRHAYWMLLAVHSFAQPLIGFLSPEDASVLEQEYVQAFPKHARLPAQQKLVSRLRQQAGSLAVPEKRGLSGLLRSRRG